MCAPPDYSLFNLPPLNLGGRVSLRPGQIVSEILATGGHSESARKAVSGRVRGTLAYLVRGGRVRKVGSFRDAKWLAL